MSHTSLSPTVFRKTSTEIAVSLAEEPLGLESSELEQAVRPKVAAQAKPTATENLRVLIDMAESPSCNSTFFSIKYFFSKQSQ
jgi:hypothetical protein